MKIRDAHGRPAFVLLPFRFLGVSGAELVVRVTIIVTVYLILTLNVRHVCIVRRVNASSWQPGKLDDNR